jgi:hypothetical protein
MYSMLGEKRGMSSTHFRRGKEHMMRLLVPTWRNDQRMQGATVCGGGW